MKSFRERRPWLVGVVSIVLIAAAVTFAFSINRFDFLRGVYRISANFEDAAGLQLGNEVRVAGVKVGRVTDIELASGAARVEMEIERDIRLPVETRVEVKLKTLLGQKFIDLQIPRAFLTAASGGNDPRAATDGYLSDGDVIPKSQTRIPYEIYQAATEGTDVLAEIDKDALRNLIKVLADTAGASKQEIGRALSGLGRATEVLADQSPEIRQLLGNARRVTSSLAESDQDIEGLLGNSAEVFGMLADNRATTSSLLAATEDLGNDLGFLIQATRGSIDVGVTDLNLILATVEGELHTIERALEELPIAQEMFGRPGKFGRFVEGHVCAITTEDTCVAEGSPEDPGVPVQGTQPQRSVLDRRAMP